MAGCSMFSDDEVFYDTPTGRKVGIVLVTNDCSSSDEDDDDKDDYGKVGKGSVRVAWYPTGKEETVTENKLVLADRGLDTGEVVARRNNGENKQRGYIRNTKVNCHVRLLHSRNSVVGDVDSTRLQHLKVWEDEPPDVVLDSWVGRIISMKDDVILKFSDGAMIQVEEDDFYSTLSSFEDIHETRSFNSEFCMNAFYVGQTLVGEIGELVDVKWLTTTKLHSPKIAKKSPRKRIHATVQDITTVEMEVRWLCRGYSQLDCDKLEPPPQNLNKAQIDRLQKLDLYSSYIQLGAHGFLELNESDKVIHYNPRSRPLVEQVLFRLKANEQAEAAREKEKNTEAAGETPMTGVAEEGGGETTTDENEKGVQTMVDVTDGDDEDDDGAAAAAADDDDEYMDEEAVDVENDSDASSVASSTPAAAAPAAAPAASNHPLRKKKKLHLRRQRKDSKPKPKAKQPVNKPAAIPPVYKPGDRVAVEVIYTYTKAEVVWQDGTVEADVPTNQLYPIHHLDELEYFPGDFVLPANNTTSSLPSDCYGVVQQVDHAGRTMIVKWLEPYHVGKAVRPAEIRTEEVSVYDVKDHMEYKFRPGHVVIRIAGHNQVASEAVNSADGSTDTKSTAAESTMETSDPVTEKSDNKSGGACDSHKPANEACGQVYDLATDGSVIIRWVSGCNARCYPQDLYLLGEELSELDSESDSDSESEDSDDSGSWETENEEEEVANEDAAQNETSLHLDSDMEEDVSMCLAKAQSGLAEISLRLNKPPLSELKPTLLQIYKNLLVVYRVCKKLDRVLDANSIESNASLKEVIALVRSEIMSEKTLMLSSKVQQKFEESFQMMNTMVDTMDCDWRRALCTTIVAEARKEEGKEDSTEVEESKGASGGVEEGKGVEEGSWNQALCDKIAKAKKEATEELIREMKEREIEDVDFGASGDQAASLDKAAADVNNLYEAASKLGAGAKQAAETSNAIEENLLSVEEAKILCNKAIDELHQQVSSSLVLFMKYQKLNNIAVIPTHEDNNADTDADADGDSHMRDIAEEEVNGEAAAAGGEESKEKIKEEKENMKLEIRNSSSTTTAVEQIEAMLAKSPQTPAEIRSKTLVNENGFSTVESVHDGHRFAKGIHQPSQSRMFLSSCMKEIKLLKSCLPRGIYIKGFEDRMDLFTCMVEGPAHTPYEGAVFFFDIQLPPDYPASPPRFHFISHCSDRLNPNLYEEGKVCVSLLGTWQGKGTEEWIGGKSSLLQVLISIQGLILNAEPYYNEAGYERQRGTQLGHENSRMYNEMALVKVVQSMTRVVNNPPALFAKEVNECLVEVKRMVERLELWLKMSPPATPTQTNSPPLPSGNSADPTEQTSAAAATSLPSPPMAQCVPHPVDEEDAAMDIQFSGKPASGPQFPLMPISKGFRLSLTKHLTTLREALCKQDLKL